MVLKEGVKHSHDDIAQALRAAAKQGIASYAQPDFILVRFHNLFICCPFDDGICMRIHINTFILSMKYKIKKVEIISDQTSLFESSGESKLKMPVQKEYILAFDIQTCWKLSSSYSFFPSFLF